MTHGTTLELSCIADLSSHKLHLAPKGETHFTVVMAMGRNRGRAQKAYLDSIDYYRAAMKKADSSVLHNKTGMCLLQLRRDLEKEIVSTLKATYSDHGLFVGRYDTVLVFGMEKMPRGIIRSSFFEPWREEAGLAATPAYFALRAQRLMLESDVTVEDLARVSVKNHRHGVANPHAMYRRAMSLEEILASPVVCEPLRLLMLCAPNEGAAAVVLSAHPSRVRVAAAALRSHLAGSVLGEHTPMSGLAEDSVPAPTEMAARDAYEEAGVGPGDLDVVELQDTDSGREILSAEELGLCARGGGGRWVRDGGGEMTSRLPVNPSGGLLSKGEPLGASALGQIVELTWQLRGQAGARQVPNARVALGHTVGRGANACVIILRT